MLPESPDEPVHTHEIDTDESPSHAVVRTVSAFSDTPVLELDPLFQTIDPEAMDSFLTTTSGGRVSFSYSGFVVTVTDGEVTLAEI